MTRPEYVTVDDERRELEVADVLKRRLRVDHVMKNPRFFPMDLTLLRGGDVVGFAEVKSRKVQSTHYKDMILSVARAINIHNFSAVTGRPTMLVYNFIDRMMGVKIIPGHQYTWQMAVMGRNDRGDPDDIEPAYLIPVSGMITLATKQPVDN